MVGTATTTMPASMVSGRRSPLRSRAANSASAARGQAVNFMADAMPKTTPEAKGRRRWASTMASSKKATTGMSSPPVASGSDAKGRMTSAWSGADLAAAVGPAQVEGHRGHDERGQAEEDPRVAQSVVGPDLARDADDAP